MLLNTLARNPFQGPQRNRALAVVGLVVISVALGTASASNRPLLVIGLFAIIAGLVTVALSPWLGVLLSILVLPMTYPSSLLGLGSRTLFEIWLIVAIGALGLAWLSKRPAVVNVQAIKQVGHAKPLVWWVVVWLILVGLEFLRNPQITLDESVLNSPGKVLYRVVLAVSLFLVILATNTTRRRIVATTAIFAASGVVPMGWGASLGITHTQVTSYNGGIVSGAASFVEGTQWRVGSTFASPFALSFQAAIVFSLALAYLLVGRRPAIRALSMGLLLLAGLTLAVAQVRAGIAGVVIGAAVMGIMVFQHRRFLTVALTMAMATGILWLLSQEAAALGRLANFSDVSTMTRLSLWQFSIDVFWRSPVIGSGLSSFETLYNSLYGGSLQIGAVSAHSTLFSVAVELGILGLVAFFGQLLSAARTAWTSWKAQTPDWLSLWVVAALATSLAFLLTEDIYIEREVMYMFYAVIAIAAAQARLIEQQKLEQSDSPVAGIPGDTGLPSSAYGTLLVRPIMVGQTRE